MSAMAILQQLGRVLEDHAATVGILRARCSPLPRSAVDAPILAQGQTADLAIGTVSGCSREAVKDGILASLTNLVKDAATNWRTASEIAAEGGHSVECAAHIQEAYTGLRCVLSKKLVQDGFMAVSVQSK